MSIVISPCHYCGHKPTLEKNGKTTYEINTVDRKYSKEGYVKGNCLPCCVKCNISKMDMPYEDFLQHVEKIFNHIKGG